MCLHALREKTRHEAPRGDVLCHMIGPSAGSRGWCSGLRQNSHAETDGDFAGCVRLRGICRSMPVIEASRYTMPSVARNLRHCCAGLIVDGERLQQYILRSICRPTDDIDLRRGPIRHFPSLYLEDMDGDDA